MEVFLLILNILQVVQVIRKLTLLIALTVLFSGCVSKKMLKAQIEETIRENPRIVLEAMRDNSIDVLAIVEKGIDARERQKREQQFDAEIKHPYNPVILPGRAVLGNQDAPVTIVEYSDFLCPYCSKGAKVVRSLVAEHPEKYRMLFKHLPMHKNSSELAAVFEALTLMDVDTAFKFHDMAFARQKELYDDKDGAVLAEILKQLHVDMDTLQEKLESPEVKERLISDNRETKEFGLDATPTFLINGVSVRGYLPADRFEKTVDLILEKSSGSEDSDGEVCEDCLNKI